MQTQLVKIDGLSKIPDLLKTAELRKSKALEFCTGLIAKLNKGLTKELDDQAQATILAVKKTAKELQDARMPLTRKMDAIKSAFTKEEKELKSLENSLQMYRDKYAKQVHDQNKEKHRQAELKQLKEAELIKLYADIEIEIRRGVQNEIDGFKAKFAASLREVNKDNWNKKMEGLVALNSDMNPDVYAGIKSNSKSKYGHDVALIMDALKAKYQDELFKHFKTNFEDFRQESIGIMNDAKKITYEELRQAITKSEEQAKIDSASAMEVAGVSAEIQKESKEAELSFSGTAQVVEEIPESRSGYQIEVINDSGYAAIAAFWFAVCAKDFKGNYLTKNLGSMVKDLEKHAHKTGEKVESSMVRYAETLKAVNRSEKRA